VKVDSLVNDIFIGGKSKISSKNGRAKDIVTSDGNHCICAVGFKSNDKNNMCEQRDKPEVNVQIDFENSGDDLKVSCQ